VRLLGWVLCCRTRVKGAMRVTAWTVATVGDRRPRSSRVRLPPCAPPRHRPASYTVRRAHNRTSRYSAHAQGRAEAAFVFACGASVCAAAKRIMLLVMAVGGVEGGWPRGEATTVHPERAP